MNVRGLTGIALHSPDPDRLARFYNETLGLELSHAEHGNIGLHYEGMVGAVHVALWKPIEKMGLFVPVFRVDDIDSAVAELVDRGVPAIHRTLDIGEGKRVATFRNPDGLAFRLIQL